MDSVTGKLDRTYGTLNAPKKYMGSTTGKSGAGSSAYRTARTGSHLRELPKVRSLGLIKCVHGLKGQVKLQRLRRCCVSGSVDLHT